MWRVQMTKQACPNGHNLSRESNFCSHCGSKTISLPEPLNSDDSNFFTQRSRRFCPQGHAISDVDHFCGICGAATASEQHQVNRAQLLTYSKRPGLRPSIAGWMQAALWTSAAASTLMCIKVISVRSTFAIYVEACRVDTFAGSQSDQYDKFRNWETQTTELHRLMSYMFLLVFITLLFLIAWANLASKASSTLSPEKRRWSSGWSVGSWFIPIASFLLPKIVLDETERIATAPRANSVVDPNWRKSGNVGANGWFWWVTRVTALIALSFGFQKLGAPVEDNWDWLTRQPKAQDLSYVLLLVGNALLVASSISGVFYVQRISRRLSPNSIFKDD